MRRIVASAIMMLSLSFLNAAVGQNAAKPFKFTLGKHVPKTIELSTKVKLEYVEQGNANGIPVIFLHGVTDSWHSYESVLHLLPENIHAFAISQRGHGDSERPATGYTPVDFANDVAAFIKQKNLGAAIIVGHSMGGVAAQQFVVLYPKLAKALVIIDSDATFADNPGMPEFYKEVLKLKGAISYEFMDEFQKSTLANPIDADYYKVIVAEGMKVPASVFQQAMKGIVEANLLSGIKKINLPVLIFWGDKDTVCHREGQERLNKAIKNSKLLIYEGTGHALHWEKPERFTSDLVKFVQQVH
jgi:non-heme chloroperoxidase